VNALTKTEIIIAAIAAAVSIIVTIIIWSIVLKKRKVRESTALDGIKLPDGVPDSAAALGFKLIENTVIVHTEDRLNDG
jgi:hypothetical protein